MTTAPAILKEIEATRDDGVRTALLRKACDLFRVSSSNLTDREAHMFDEVLNMLCARVDTSMRMEVSEQIAEPGQVLKRTVRGFAMDEEVDVARPVLERATNLTDEDLIEIAKTRGQDHMAAIADRQTLNPEVTDTLVELGENRVLRTVAGNSGARFSDPGMERLADRSTGDEHLQSIIAKRNDLTGPAIEKLIAVAAGEVLEVLVNKSQNARRVVEKARSALETELGIDRIDFIAADRKVRRIAKERPADEGMIRAFAERNMTGELMAAIGLVMNLKLEQSKQMILEHNALLIAARAHDFSSKTLRAILTAGPVYCDMSDAERDQIVSDYNNQSTETAQRIMRFWRTRNKLATG